MSLRPPTESEIRELAADLHLDLTDEEVADFQRLVTDSLGAYETVAGYGRQTKPAPVRERDSGVRAGDEDPLNGWITRCDVRGADDGPLAGMDVALKDNICLAGVEMTCGSRVMEGYVPDVDATVVTRLLDAGANIVGKANMDDMALTGAGFSSAFGPTLNPRNPEYLSGGSSGGCAIVVATGEADVAIGADQGGSIRAPASWSGIVGHKPTHGLVPYRGIMGMENTIDYAGPMTNDVRTCARTLSVIAGKTDGDPRQPAEIPVKDYEASLDKDVLDLSIAVVEEGFTRPGAEDIVNEHVREALDRLADRGATVEEVSVPIHADSWDIHSVALAEGLLASVRKEGMGHGWRGWYNTSWVNAFGKFRRAQGFDFPVGIKLTLLQGAYMSEQYHSQFFAQAMNLRSRVADEYDAVLEEHDFIAMPTTPQTAQKYVPDMDRFKFAERAWPSLTNCAATNFSGHPSLSVPVTPDDSGLPVGLMLTGRRFEDGKVLAAGVSVESLYEEA